MRPEEPEGEAGGAGEGENAGDDAQEGARSPAKIFTLSEARALLPDVKRICAFYKSRFEGLQAEMQEGRPMVEREVRALLQDWTEEIEALGAEPKGLWLVDFDSGDGFYYCWQLGEDAIAHVHEYEAGFSGRRPIAG